jgi:hypothetical protein
MFYIGIVEDNLDPLKMGRLRIRVIGVHTENRSQVGTPNQFLLTEELPWAMPAYPISNSNIDGVSDFSGIEKGTKVYVFFLDRFQQKPVYFGVASFIFGDLPDYEQGFTDPSGEHPIEDFKGESSISRLARNENTEKTCVKTKQDNLTTFSVNDVQIDEPEPGYAAQYPYNRVIETKSGIIIELDDTPNAERIHIYHPSNTYTEIYPDGSKVSKTSANNFEITIADKFEDIEGNFSLKVKGATSVEIEGATILTCNGTVDATFKEDVSVVAEKQIFIDAEDSVNIGSSNEVNIGSANELNISGANTNISATGNLNIEATGSVTLSSTGNLNIEATGSVTLSSTSVLNIESNGVTNISSEGVLNIDCISCSLSATGAITMSAGTLINLN